MINFTKKLLLGIFQVFYLKVSGDMFYRTPPCSKKVVHGFLKIIQAYLNKINNSKLLASEPCLFIDYT